MFYVMETCAMYTIDRLSRYSLVTHKTHGDEGPSVTGLYRDSAQPSVCTLNALATRSIQLSDPPPVASLLCI